MSVWLMTRPHNRIFVYFAHPLAAALFPRIDFVSLEKIPFKVNLKAVSLNLTWSKYNPISKNLRGIQAFDFCTYFSYLTLPRCCNLISME